MCCSAKLTYRSDNVIDCTAGPDVACCSIAGFKLFLCPCPQLLLSPAAAAEEGETAVEAKSTCVGMAPWSLKRTLTLRPPMLSSTKMRLTKSSRTSSNWKVKCLHLLPFPCHKTLTPATSWKALCLFFTRDGHLLSVALASEKLTIWHAVVDRCEKPHCVNVVYSITSFTSEHREKGKKKQASVMSYILFVG